MTPDRLPAHWLLPADRAYPMARTRLSASSWQADRCPAAISRPGTAEQVRTDMRTAADRGLRVAVRSGGHSTSATHLDDAAVTLDLGAFHDFAVDTAGATAWIGPGLTALEVARALDGTGLFFPLGHAPTVGVGGFLLAGGNGWNTPVWGHACDRVLAAEVILADGRVRTIDAETDPDLFAALRGAGPAFPAVVTAFQVSLVREQPQIRRLLLTVDGGQPEVLGRALDGLIDELPARVETTVFWHPARGPGERPRATVAATSFRTGGGADGLETLRSADLPVLSAAEDAPGPSLLRLIDPLPRHHGEAIFSHHTWTDTGYADVLPLLPEREEQLLPHSCVLLTTAARHAGPGIPVLADATRATQTGGTIAAADATERAEALYRPAGRLSVSAYAHWDPVALPAEIATTWARDVISQLQPLSTGRYVGEADLTGAATSAEECFGREGAATLAATRTRVDPDSLLHSPFPF